MIGRNKKGEFFKALCAGDVAKVTEFLDKGMTPNIRHNYTSPLEIAINRNNQELTALLIDRGAQTTFAIRETIPSRPEILALLHDKGVKATPDNLCYAARIGNLEIVTYLLENNPELDINGGDPENYRYTALHHAAEGDYAKVVAYLLEKGADPDKEDSQNRKALYRAQQKNSKEAEALLAPVTKGIIAPATKTEEGWKKLGDEKVALVTLETEIGYRITEIFNFHNRDHVRIAQNIETKAETMAARSFDDISDKALLEEALKELNARGGKADAGSISGLRKGPGL